MKVFSNGLAVAGCLFAAFGTAGATELVTNGDFEAGNSGFTSGYSLVSGGTNSCYPETTYAIVTSPNACHNLWSSFGDHTTGSGNMMAVNGATRPNVVVWSESVSIDPNTQYSFSAWIASSYPTSPAVLSFDINGSDIGDFTASTSTGVWQQFQRTWVSGASDTTATLAIFDNNTAASGNDFALDDISLQQAPEPGCFGLIGSGLAALAFLGRRKRWSQR